MSSCSVDLAAVAARVSARAALTEAPSTLVSAAEVQALLGLELPPGEGWMTWSAWLEELGLASVEGRPITSWRDAARVLGLSEDTMRRRRAEHRDRTTNPWWADADAVRSWWAALVAPAPAPTPKARQPKPRPARTEALDIAALRREIASAR